MTTIKYLEKKCSDCGKGFITKHKTKSYCKECYSIRQKEYREERKGYYLYVVKKGKDVQYVGATESLKDRMSSHLNLHSNIKELIEDSDKWDCIKYIDLTELLEERLQLLYLENFLMDIYNTSTKYNSQYNRIPEEKIDKLKMFSLISMIHSTEFSTYITREEYLRKKDKKNNLSKRQ